MLIVGGAKEVKFDLYDEVVMWLREYVALESKEHERRLIREMELKEHLQEGNYTH